jgi:hypothetical protein
VPGNYLPTVGPRPRGSPHSSDDSVLWIIVVVVVVVIVVPTVLAALFLVDITSNVETGPGSVPLGSAFAAGNPVGGTCSSNATPAVACANSTDFAYTLTIEQSAVDLGSVLFEVTTPTGAIYSNVGPAEFSLVGFPGILVAESTLPAGSGLAMSGTWSEYGVDYSASSPMLNTFTIVIDMGQSAPTTGLGLTFVAIGIGGYSGTTAPLTLP